jgi:polysaccharide pyruvyl transferase WcaK-like protein
MKGARPPVAPTAAGHVSPAHRPRIGLFGLFGSGNFGSDGSLKAMIGLVRRACADARLICICNGPERVQARFGIEAIAIKRARATTSRFVRRLRTALAVGPNTLRAIAYLWRVDALIIPGTGILDDFCSGPLGVPLDVFTWCVAARLTRTPIWFVSIGAGPIVHPLSRRLMLWSAMLAQYRSYRDPNSMLFLAKAGIDTRCDMVFPDLAFDLPRPEILPERPADEPLTVGVGVMSYWGWSESPESSAIHGAYQERLSRLCVWLLEERGCRIRLLSSDDTDQRAIRALRSLLEVRLADPTLIRNVVVEPAGELADLMTQIAATDIVVATRHHNVVCALKMGKPTLSLTYAAKNVTLLEDAGLGGYWQDVESLDIERLKSQLEQLFADRSALAQSIAAFGALTKKRLQRQEELLSIRLRGLGRPRALASEGAHRTALEAPVSAAARSSRAGPEQRLRAGPD